MTKEKDKNNRMLELSKLGASKGGKKRQELMTKEERSAHASMAASKRWNKNNNESNGLPRVTHHGTLIIGNAKIKCAVLDDKRRILSERSATDALGGKRGGSHWLRRKKGSKLPVFLSAGNLVPFIPPSLVIALSRPVKYSSIKGSSSSVNGIEATLLPEICDVWLKARDAGDLLESQKHIAKQADILIRGLAHVGIIALIDEATGYQKDRDRNELHLILEQYIARELLPWTKRFPDDFYAELFRLRGWSYSPFSPKRPILVGKLTNDIIYERLPRNVLKELQTRNPVNKETGRRKYKHFQFLSEDIGNPHLEKHLSTVTTLMRISSTWRGFKRLLDKAFPLPGKTMEMTLEDVEIES